MSGTVIMHVYRKDGTEGVMQKAMGKRDDIKTSKKECIEYWKKHINESEIGTDWDTADCRCWRCGRQADLQRCHIIPDALGGKDEASNIVLLCDKCHEEGPNVEDSEIMWDWIKAYARPNEHMYLFAQIEREYEYIYKRSLREEVEFFSRFLGGEEINKMVALKILDASQHATNHFGKPFLSVMNGVGILRMYFKGLAEEFGIQWK